MTLTLQLDAEQQACLERLAGEAGQTPEDYVRAAAGIAPSVQRTPAQAHAAMMALRGKYPGLRSTDEYIRDKQDELEREEARSARRSAGL